MVDFPFQQPQTLSERQNRALALAAVFQATQLTHMTAMSGQKVWAKVAISISNS